ncbi:reverse transcriptase family protein [Dawidia soli]|uniref:RNA-directed DNA polymerase n=1 Tax=Dawidia soli TaxID=2782352 RepID=A0AAP2GIG3_9BACT|nr:reverse transcriptase family protein [Dawidia soli]MBT1687395.1 reverse transcriptase family protein [Dawidia soli]
MKDIIENIDAYYYQYESLKRDKFGNVKKYSDGTPKKRVITPSTEVLKKIQRNIKKYVLDTMPVPGHMQGAVKGKSNISNAKIHQGKKYRFVTDLMDFFPNVYSDSVYSFFLSLGYTNHVASWLTRLTTHKGKLPQGTPTSPALANFCFLEIDQKLLSICQAKGITYTRFVDDLTFSAPHDFRTELNELLRTISANGHRISYRKTDYGNKQTVTGISIQNNYIDVPAEIKEKAKVTVEHNGFNLYMNNVRNTNKNMKHGIKANPQ